MREVLRRSEPIPGSVDIGDRDAGELLFRDALQAPDIDPVDLSDGRVRSDTEGTDAASSAKEVHVLSGIEPVLRKFRLACQQAKVIRRCNRRPEPGSAADGAIAAIRGLGEVKVCLELDCPAMATAVVGLEHM